MASTTQIDRIWLRKKRKRRSKFNNRRVKIQGHWFDSQKEGNRFLVLMQDLKEGRIRNLELQVPFNLEVNGVHICKYVADFVYEREVDWSDEKPCMKVWVRIVNDAKGYKTRVYKIKKALMKACHGIDILET